MTNYSIDDQHEAGTESDSEEVTPIGVTYAYVEHGEQRSAFRACTLVQAIDAAVDHLDAIEHDGGYAYRAEETGGWYAVTDGDMAHLGAAVLDGRASLAYSLWCAGCGEEISDPTDPGEDAAPRTVHCECGKCTGVRCNWVGDPAETVVVEWMPPHHRASHEAAGYAGWYPHNGAWHLTVELSCAESLVESDGEWCTIVETPESSGALTGVETDPGDGAAS